MRPPPPPQVTWPVERVAVTKPRPVISSGLMEPRLLDHLLAEPRFIDDRYIEEARRDRVTATSLLGKADTDGERCGAADRGKGGLLGHERHLLSWRKRTPQTRSKL